MKKPVKRHLSHFVVLLLVVLLHACSYLPDTNQSVKPSVSLDIREIHPSYGCTRQDGSLDVYFPKESAENAKVANWLAIHDGAFALQGSKYWPNPEALEPLYVPSAMQKQN